MNEHQWRMFEYNMSRWMIENKYILDQEEKKKFYKCANYSLGTGIANASLIYFLCKKYKNYFTPVSRFFLTFSFGVYTSMVVNKIYRRKAYTEILTSKTSMTDKAREVMNDILNTNDKNVKLSYKGINQNEENKTIENTNSYNLMDENDSQINNDFKLDDNNNTLLTEDINDNIRNEQINEIERQNSYFLKDFNEGKSVSWDEIRRRNE
ncbi:conserved Plasmodium protein, unknown function [Plasmodium gallinaceum]|uniref:Transmembrane protein n=1 Tax=Plasmodium gallinaceum TaxID=5849 RepID=A0A1J1GTY1_PLAGA|nr:conserved Plasmodium protein, unknown function [Plasmodium gallinaceum]CRG95911.1 conserved Plasmodium protein, unknown function [Plasmodium gallinaceum]